MASTPAKLALLVASLTLLVQGLALAQTPVDVGCSPTVANPTCSAGSSPAGPQGNVAQTQRAQAAFSRGEAAYGQGNLDDAVRFFQEAARNSPENPFYAQRVRQVLYERYNRTKAKPSGALDEAYTVKQDQESAASRTTPTRGVYDRRVEGVHAPQPPPVSMSAMPGAGALAQKLGISLDLNDPKNFDVIDALTRVQYMLMFNENAQVTGAGKVDRAGLQSQVTTLNKALQAHGVAPTTTEKAEAGYKSYKLGLQQQTDQKPEEKPKPQSESSQGKH